MQQPETEFIELPGEEIRDIMGTPPRLLVRVGTAVVCMGVALMLLTAYLVSYPDIVRAPVYITTTQPPVRVVARTDGYVQQTKVTDGQMVKAGQLLIVLQSTASADDVLLLEKRLETLQNLDIDQLAAFNSDRSLQLGEIGPSYTAFIQALAQYSFRKSSTYDSRSITQLQAQLEGIRRGIRAEREREKSLREQLEIERRALERAKNNYADRNISLDELERIKSRVIEAEKAIKEVNAGIIQREERINDINREILQVQQGSSQGKYEDLNALVESLGKLRQTVEQWKQRYTIIAPIDGRVSFFGKLQGERQNVAAGEEILAIAPNTQDTIVARVDLPVSGSGKVEAGQRVLIKFDSYPYQEFGIVEGVVASKALVPNNNNVFSIVVQLPHGLKTSYNLQLRFDQQMPGTAEIITANRRFLSRILDPLISAFKNK